MKHFLITVFASIALLSQFAVGQGEFGSISGTVRDTSGAVVTGADVTATNVATSAVRKTVTSGLGEYTLSALTPGNYRLQITKVNFQTFEKPVEVTVGGKLTVDAQLAVGKETTVVEVVAGTATEVNTQTQEISQLVGVQQMAQLPSLTRNAYDFVAISGNVSSGDNSCASTTNAGACGQNQAPRGVGYALNGQRESGTEILLDGVENVSLFTVAIGQDVPMDAVQEYSVVTNNFGAEYGRTSGGVVNVSTKSGTNNFHGSAWEFNRLSAYTANTFANDAANAAAGSIVDPKGIYTRNQFGFAAGGPIIKNKLFVFESTEWTRVRSSASETEEVLDPTFISMLPSNIRSYYSAFGTGQLPASTTVPPTTAGALGLCGTGAPLINGTTPIPCTQPVFDTVNFKAPFDAGGGVPSNTYTLVGRVDYNLSDKNQMFFRYGRERIDQFAGSFFYSPYPQYDIGQGFDNDSVLYSLTHVFNPHLLNTTKVSFTRFDTLNTFNSAVEQAPNLYIVPTVDPVTGIEIQQPGLQNTVPGVGGFPYGGPQNTIQLEPDVAWIKGRHSMHFGGQLTYIQINQAYGAYNQAVEQLGTDFGSSMAALVNSGGATQGGVFASPLYQYTSRVAAGVLPCVQNPDGSLVVTAGCTVTPPLSPAVFARSYRYKDWAAYAQDSFRITPRLTLNYGLRYEHYGVQHNNHQNLDSNFYFGPGTSLGAQIASGQVFLTSQSPIGQFWAPRWGTAAPRVGFAYDLFGDGKSSLRGGFGISYERNFGNVTYNASFNPPASAVVNTTCTAISCPVPIFVTNNDRGPLGVAGPPTGLPPSELRMPDPNINVAQTQFWSLALQREVARGAVVEASYTGAHGVHLYDIFSVNPLGGAQAWLGESTTLPGCPSPCLTRPNPQYANINMRDSSGTSSYNALNLKFQAQNLHNTGLGMVANFTWAHSLDDLSSTFSDSAQGGSGYIGNLGYTNPLDPKLDWGSSDFDVRHRLVVSPIWELPFYKGQHGILGEALGGWTLSGIFSAHSGIPFSVYDATYNLNAYALGLQRLIPATPVTSYQTGAAVPIGTNLYNILNIPLPAAIGPLNPALGISDFGPFPADMTHRNAFRGPGAWNFDTAVSKNFRVTEHVGLSFRAEGFNIFNHHNLYVNTTNLEYGCETGPSCSATGGAYVTGEYGGLGSVAISGNHDERRFGQFALRVSF